MSDNAFPRTGAADLRLASGIDLSRGLYPLALSVMRINAAPVTLAVAVLLLLNIAQSFAGPTLAMAPLRLGLMVLFAHAAYRVLLTAGAVHGCPALADPQGRAPLRFLGLMVLIFLPIVLIGAVWTTPGGPALLGGLVFVGAVLAMVLASGALMIFVGTALPELAETGHADPLAAFRRGRDGYRRIARGLILGPGLFGVAHGIVLVTAGLMGLPQGAYDPVTGSFSPGALAVLTLLSLSNLYSVTLTAVVLTRAYLEAEPAGIDRGARLPGRAA